LKNQRNVKVFKVNFSDGTCQRAGEKTESQSFLASKLKAAKIELKAKGLERWLKVRPN